MENPKEETRFDKKRTRVDSESDCPAPKLLRVDTSAAELIQVDSVNSVSGPVELEANSHEARHIQEELLDILNDTDLVNDCDPAIPELDSVIGSFQEEIRAPESAPAEMTSDPGEILVELTSDAGESSRGLGYLLEASDDELGLPPMSSPSWDEQVIQSGDLDPSGSRDVGYGQILEFDEQIPNYDPFELEIGDDSENSGRRFDYDNSSDFLMLDGLFDHAELIWQPESLSAHD